MKRLFWALAAALMMFAPAALAQTAQEITDTCTLSAVGKKTLGRMTDGQYQTYWASSSGSYAYVEIEAEEAVGGLYVQFYEDIAALEVQTTDDAGAWRTVFPLAFAVKHAVFHVQHADLFAEAGKRTLQNLHLRFGCGGFGRDEVRRIEDDA